MGACSREEERNREEWVIVQGKRRRRSKLQTWKDLVSMFVGNMPEDVHVEWLKRTFSFYGKVVDAYIPASTRRGKGWCFGFVRFREMNLALRAINVVHGNSLGGRKLVVNIARFGWKEEASSDI